MIRNQKIKPNFNCISITTEAKEIDIWFSYETAVGLQITDLANSEDNNFFIAINDFSSTTGKHLAYLDGGTKESKSVRVPQRIIQNLIEKLIS